MPSNTRRAGTALAVTALVTAGLAVGASTAYAKSELGISARSGVVAAGGTVRLSADGDTDDFGGAPIRLCLDQRTAAGGWRQLSCTTGYRLTVDVKAPGHGTLAFRAQLLAQTAPRHWVVDRTSKTVTVRVR